MRELLLAALLFTSALGYEVVEDRSALKIQTPALKERKERKIRLDNGLEALLISDPETKESGAALAVAVGSWNDPEDRPGMAHFVEHMLFLGTQKYPEEEGYSRYLDEHGGSQNAFTMADRTVYMFSVHNEGFKQALDRFGQFFLAPLFNPSGVDRESKAIHQEFCRDLPLDPWRMHFVRKELANPHHPFHRFCIGNCDTLLKISQDELKAWYASHYSADLMHLVVYSSQDLDSLEKEIVTLFSPIRDNLYTEIPSEEPIFDPTHCGKLATITPIQDLQILELTWELPRTIGAARALHIDKLVSHVLGHEGETSLLAALKRENLAESISAGNHHAGKNQYLFSLTIRLTSKGIKEYEKVIKRCYEAIATLRQYGIPRYVYDEIVEMEELKYRFQPRKEIFDLVSDLAVHLVDEPLETFPRYSLLPISFAPEKVGEFLSTLTPRNCQYVLMASPSATGIKPTKTERWMGVEYTLLNIDEHKLSSWEEAKPHFQIALPKPNPFLPSQIEIVEAASVNLALPTPTLLLDTPSGKLFCCTDERFLVPEISWSFMIKTPKLSAASARSFALADLFCLAVNEQLNSTSYEALLAGLTYKLETNQNGISLKILGYSDKAPVLLKTLLDAMRKPLFAQDNFNLYKEQLYREYVNRASASPLKQGSELLWSILYKDYPLLNERAARLKEVNYEQFTAFCSTLFEKTYIEGMLYGNHSHASVWKTFEETIARAPFAKEDHMRKELATLPDRTHPSFHITETPHPANALILTADCGPFTFKRRAAQEILSKGLEEPFFSELRTRQQTAYLVTNWSQELERHLYSFFAIQSSSHDNRDLLSRFELFLESSLQHLQESVIPKERFEAIQAALVYKLEHPAENLAKMGEILHMLAFDYDGSFDWLEKRKQGILDLSYQEFLDYAEAFIGKRNPRRLALFINGSLPPQHHLSYQEIIDLEQIRKEISYTGRHAISGEMR